MKITIGGLSGTGTSTIGRMLAKKLDYKFESGGNIARQMASEKGMTIEEYDKYLLDIGDTSSDFYRDNMQKEFGKNNDNFVLESRLGWFNVPDSKKIKLICEDGVRFERTSKKDPERIGTVVEDFDQTKRKSLEREKVHRDRIFKNYGIEDLNDDKHFDFIVDTTSLNQDQVLEKILIFLELN